MFVSQSVATTWNLIFVSLQPNLHSLEKETTSPGIDCTNQRKYKPLPAETLTAFDYECGNSKPQFLKVSLSNAGTIELYHVQIVISAPQFQGKCSMNVLAEDICKFATGLDRRGSLWRAPEQLTIFFQY